MNRFLFLAIGCTIATSAILMPVVSVLAQTPETQAPETEPSPQPSEAEPSPPASEAQPAVPEGYQTVTGDDWSFAVPSDWQNVLSDSVDLGEGANLVAQLNDSQKQVVVNLVTQSYKGDNNDYIEQSLKTLSDLGFTVHTQEPLTLSGLQGVDLDVSLASAQPPTHLLQRLIAGNGTGFALTCGGKEENFAAAEAICKTIISSFQVTP